MTSPLQFQLDSLPGMTDEDGVIGRLLLPAKRPMIPLDIHLEGDLLQWREAIPGKDGWPRGLEHEVNLKGMLDRFIRIKTDEDVLKFAMQFGPLRLCEEHKLPSSHRRSPYLEEEGPPDPASWCKTSGFPDHCSEPTEEWGRYILSAQGLLEVGASVWGGKPAPRAVWAKALILYQFEHAADLVVGMGKTLAIDRIGLSFAVQTWLDIANIKIEWNWWIYDHEPRFQLQADTFGHLALQLAQALSRREGGLAFCDGCERVYLRSGRKPQTGRRNFCPDKKCQTAAAKLRQRDKREEDRRKPKEPR